MRGSKSSMRGRLRGVMRRVVVLLLFIGAGFHLWFAEASGIWLYVAAAAVGWVNPGVYGANGIYYRVVPAP